VDRDKVLSTITDLFGMLEHEPVEYSFLSVDVAGSAELKRGENPVRVELSFRAYHQWVAAVVTHQGGEVHSTAGDGAMCRFARPQAAVKAAQELQQQLPTFNQRQNRISKPFAIRCGVHSGEVVAQEGGPVAQVFSGALDVAAHLQQIAPSGAVAISATTYRHVAEQSEFVPTSVVVDDELVYLWPPSLAASPEDGAKGDSC
jgi:class 3 adenylate cyclase